MLTGTRPFVGDDVSKTLAHVIAIDPDWDTLPKELSPVLGTFLHGCLEKKPKQRVRDIGDMRLAMAGVFEVSVSTAEDTGDAPSLQWWQRPVPTLILALVIAVCAALAGSTLTRPEGGLADVVRFAIASPDDRPLLLSGLFPDLAISPDGSLIVYSIPDPIHAAAQRRLRPIGQLASEFLHTASAVMPRGPVAFVRATGNAVTRLVVDPSAAL